MLELLSNVSCLVLWPVFHYLVLTKDSDGQAEKQYWKDYVAVNRIFADTIASQYRAGDISKVYMQTLFFETRDSMFFG